MITAVLLAAAYHCIVNTDTGLIAAVFGFNETRSGSSEYLRIPGEDGFQAFSTTCGLRDGEIFCAFARQHYVIHDENSESSSLAYDVVETFSLDVERVAVVNPADGYALTCKKRS